LEFHHPKCGVHHLKMGMSKNDNGGFTLQELNGSIETMAILSYCDSPHFKKAIPNSYPLVN
jgi:hypothetical protein